MIYLTQSQNPMAQVIQSCIDVFSVFVAVVLACLILYADRFLVRRRKRELGTYLLLGLSQGQVSLLLVLETGLIGAASLALGLLLGLAASQGLSALTLSMFSFGWTPSGWPSPRAAGRTVLYFGLIFLLVMGFSGIQISRAKLLDLMQGGRKNEELRPRPSGPLCSSWSWAGYALAAAYAILLTFGMAFAVVLPLPVHPYADSWGQWAPCWSFAPCPALCCGWPGATPASTTGTCISLPCASGSAGSTLLTCPRP
ncbi:MAG: ABC transporter permease [Lawsonibacter sp.]